MAKPLINRQTNWKNSWMNSTLTPFSSHNIVTIVIITVSKPLASCLPLNECHVNIQCHTPAFHRYDWIIFNLCSKIKHLKNNKRVTTKKCSIRFMINRVFTYPLEINSILRIWLNTTSHESCYTSVLLLLCLLVCCVLSKTGEREPILPFPWTSPRAALLTGF